MKRITKKRLQEFIDKVAYIDEWDANCGPEGIRKVYLSKIDGGYFTHVGLENNLKYLLKKGITEQLQNKSNIKMNAVNIGFNPTEQKWYGWSHRAIYGFGVGSECKKGDCGYVPDSVDELYDSITKPDKNGWAWQKPENVMKMTDRVRIRVHMTTCGPKDIVDKCDAVYNLKEEVLLPEPAPPKTFDIKVGRGEWTAKTLEDAKQMAMDFAEGVS